MDRHQQRPGFALRRSIELGRRVARGHAGLPSRRANVRLRCGGGFGGPAGTQRGRHQLASRVSSRVAGERNRAASSRCSGSTRGDPPRSAIVRATRRSRSVPRPVRASRSASATARAMPAGVSPQVARNRRPARRPFSAPLRRTWTRRAALMRCATIADDSGSRPAINAAGGTRAIVTQRSIRSRSGPETRPAYLSGTPIGHRHRPYGSPAKPHGQGFMAATSWNRAGNRMARPTRAMDTCPSSSGWRSASSTSRPNSGSSSRNSTP